MQNTSILKQNDQNFQTNSTNESQSKWINRNDIVKVKAQFKGMQVKLLNMFTVSKSQLSLIYQQIVNKIKRLQKSLHNQNNKINSTFWKILEDIQLEIQQKINNMSQNIQNSVTSPFLFDQLLALMPDMCNTSQHQLSSQRKVNGSNNNNSGSSTSNKFIQKNSQIIVDVDSIGLSEYKNAIKIRPNQKRLQNLGCLSGKWDLLQSMLLQNKHIFRMVPLSTVIADNLQQINLSNNQLPNLQFLKQAQYPILRTLNLKKNNISSIEGIQNAKFPHLRILNISQNRIKKIDLLKHTNFQQLIDLNLSINKIEQPNILSDCDFPKLQILNIDNNNIQNIDFLPNCSFYRLKIFSFCYNQVKRIDSMKRCKLQKLQAFLGYNNKIQSIDCLENCDFPMLKQIVLNNNMIKDISVVEKMKFKNLLQFDLENNNIQPKQVFCFVTKNDQCVKAKKRYPFIQL